MIYMILFLFGCATTTVGVIYRTKDISSSLANPSNYTIAVLPTLSVGNPDRTDEPELTIKFESGLRGIGFKVIDSYFVSGVIEELKIDLSDNLSLEQMKQIKQKLNCDLLCMSTLEYRYIPGQGGGYANKYGAGASSRGGYYRISSETFKIIDPSSLETLVSISKLQQSNRSMSQDIILALKEHFIGNE